MNAVGSTITVDMGTLSAGTTGTIQLLASIDSNQTADITNTATVSAFEIETDNLNNSSSELLELVASDLSIVKSGSPDPVDAGSTLTYTKTVTKNGPDPAAGVSVVDTLPSDVTFVSGEVDGSSASVLIREQASLLRTSVP